MACSNLVLFIFTASIFYIANGVLRSESIVGGFYADEHLFQYQAAISGKRNHSRATFLMGSASIVADKFVLAASQCFVNVTGALKDFTFSVIVDSIDLKTPAGIFIPIEKIYIPNDNSYLLYNDISVAKLKKPLNVSSNVNLYALKIPAYLEKFAYAIGTVSGYGLISVETTFNPDFQMNIMSNGQSDFLLKYAFVRILTDDECTKTFPLINKDTQMCGIMMTERSDQRWGLCAKDIGVPLTFGSKIVGIASRISPDCDDTVNGAVYTKVSTFSQFIQTIINTEPDTMDIIENLYATVYYNRPHII